MRRTTLILTICLFIFSCSQNENSPGSNTNFDSIFVIDKNLFYPDTQKGRQFELGLIATAEQRREKHNWATMYKDKFICADYFIKKENIKKFIDSFNAVDIFKITNFDYQDINLIDDEPLKSTDTLIQSSYTYIGAMPEQVCTLKKLNEDSVPVKFNFSITANKIGIPKTITMSVCADSLTSLQILKILKRGNLAKTKR